MWDGREEIKERYIKLILKRPIKVLYNAKNS
jgi:hypothetical protein